MSVSPVNQHLSIYQPSNANSAKNYLQQIESSLNSGNLQSAQQAYSSLQNALSNPSSGNQSTNPLSNDLSALGQALQSGNTTAAQQALQNIKQHVKAAHHHGGQSPESAVWGSSSQQISTGGQDSDGDSDGSGSVSAGFSVSA